MLDAVLNGIKHYKGNAISGEVVPTIHQHKVLNIGGPVSGTLNYVHTPMDGFSVLQMARFPLN